jgi:putative ABC transport system permease protein
MHMSVSALPTDTLDKVRAVDGVAWADNLRYTTGIVGNGDNRIVTYVFGYDTTTGHAGPRTIAAGHAPGDGEVLIDQAAAGELGIHVGDRVDILGSPLTVSGLSTNGTNIVNTTVFISTNEFTKLHGPGVNYILAGARPGITADQLASRIAAAEPDTTVQTRAQFSEQEARLVADMATDVMSIMTIIGLLIALAVVALTLFTVTLSKLREYGIIKALGGTGRRLALDVATQATWTVLLATAVATVLAVLIGLLLGAVTTNVRIVVEPAAVARVGLGALVIGGVAAVVPLRRVLAVDPASAFRRPT